MISCLAALCHAQQPQQVHVEGDQNYNNDRALVYDGIDVSRYQKDIDWRTTASDKNIQYVYVKATEGANYVSSHYRRNIENARKHGVKVGAYHFMRPGLSVKSQFDNFTRIVKIEEQDLIPLLDVEKKDGWSIKQLQDSVKRFAQMLEAHYGCKPMIYTSSSWFNNYLGADFVGYPLFIARYSKSEPQLNFGAKWTLWQFSDKGRIKGIDANVDLSRFNRGVTINDILINKRAQQAKQRRSNQRSVTSVPFPKKKQRAVQQEVPMSPRQRKEAEERRLAELEKQDPKLAKQRAKDEKEKKRRDEEARKKREKEQKELEKKQKEQERKERDRIEKEQRKRTRVNENTVKRSFTTPQPAEGTSRRGLTRTPEQAFGGQNASQGSDDYNDNTNKRTRTKRDRQNGASSDN